MWQVILQENMTYHIESLYTSGKYDFMHCYTMYMYHSTQWVNLVMCHAQIPKYLLNTNMENTSDFCILFCNALYQNILSQPMYTQWYETIIVFMFPFTFLLEIHTWYTHNDLSGCM